MMYGYYGNMYGWGPFGSILSVLFWVIVVVIIISIFRGMGMRKWDRWDRWHNAFKRNGALDLLNERYVKGEITKEEYEAKKKDITS